MIMGIIRKKSLETLKQQKKSFINFIKTKEKYREESADLFEDQDLEKIDDMNEVKHHLEEKWISKELVDTIETDYVAYLRSQSYYWWIEDYPDDIKESIKENDKTLSKIKEDIIKEYEENKEFVALDINKLIENNFWKFDEKKLKNISEEIWELRIEIKELKEKNRINEEEIKNLENEYEKLSILKFKKKKEVTQKIEDKKNENTEIQEIIKRKEEEYRTKIKRDNIIFSHSRQSDIKNIIWQKKWTNLTECKKSLQEMREEISEYYNYIPEDQFKYINKIIYEKILENKETEGYNIGKMINEYLNYFFIWEDSFIRDIPTIYTKNKVDEKIMNIIKDLKIWLGSRKIPDIDDVIDYDFIDDVFIHTTWFRVLDEILEEWWLVSTNEANKRWRSNEDIKNSITQKEELKEQGALPHKDIYFSRGFRKNLYWHNKSDDDYIFIANTMSNFANNWYWIPLNSEMQPDSYGETIKNAIGGDHDSYWYSIISKSAIEKNEQNDSYSKINLKDVYIFVCETKKKEIEWNPKYKIKEANIIYFPEKYKWEMTYELYEYIKNEISRREEKMQKRTPIPNKIITSEYGIESVKKEYRWAFCTPKTTEGRSLLNPIKNWDYREIIKFLEKRTDFNGWSINLKELEDYLLEKKEEINSLSHIFQYPKELIILLVVLLKVWISGHYFSSVWKWIKRFGYSLKETSILCEIAFIINGIEIHKYNYNNYETWRIEYLKRIKDWCDIWWIDLKKMEKIVIKISNLTKNGEITKLVKKIFDEQYNRSFKRIISNE